MWGEAWWAAWDYRALSWTGIQQCSVYFPYACSETSAMASRKERNVVAMPTDGEVVQQHRCESGVLEVNRLLVEAGAEVRKVARRLPATKRVCQFYHVSK
jgi:hypothetical protein